MAFDGITVAAVVSELNDKLSGGRIDKIYQPENDEVHLLVRCKGQNHRLLATCAATNPRVHITNNAKQNPINAPLFVMVLRKHLSGGRIVGFEQPDFDRVIYMNVESMNEMGDLTVKRLVIEIMGKHSNIILVNEDGVVLDSVKHVSRLISSVRQVLPGYKFEKAPSQNKKDPVGVAKGQFLWEMESAKGFVQKAIYMTYTGVSPAAATEIMTRAGVEQDKQCSDLTEDEAAALYIGFDGLIEEGRRGSKGYVAFDDIGKPFEFSMYKPFAHKKNKTVEFNGVSELLDSFYKDRDNVSRIQQKSHDMKRLVQLNVERCLKKREIQKETLEEIEDRDYYKLCGELLTSNIYAIKKGADEFTTVNFFDENLSEITISLDKLKTPNENAQAYFKKYNKQKRAFEALQTQIAQNDAELDYFDSILTSLQSSSDENDINDVRDELTEQGFLKKRTKRKGEQVKKSAPLRFVSSDGFEIFVGKNNKQNDELTFRFAMPDDIWLHTKNIPGSHVILRCGGKKPTDLAITEAAEVAAFYSKAKNGTNVPVDYAERKNVKKPNGAKPGFVIYETNKTAVVTPKEIVVL